MIYRNISRNDFSQFKELINSKFSYDHFCSFLKNILNENHIIIVLEMNNNIIGSGTILIEEKLTYGGCKMGHLENIIINKKYRGKGYGEKLIKELLRICKENKCYRVDLNCNKELEKFYEKNNMNFESISMNIIFKENFN